ncbi:hypothetical protein CsatB_017734 [Cannabis sativa]
MIKINVDGTVFAKECAYDGGIIARGADGNIIEAFAVFRLGEVQPMIAKIIGIKEALSWIKKKNRSVILIETDSLIATQALSRHAFYFWFTCD